MEENSLTELLPELDIQELPKASNAIPLGDESPPPEKGEFPTLAPLALSSLTVLVPAFVIHTCPFRSTAIADGALSPLG